MRVAVPLFKERISPHFSTSAEVLLVDVKGKRIIDERRTYWEELKASEKIEKLNRWGVNVLLCGGITRSDKVKIESLNIDVVSELMGDAKDVLDRWLRQFIPKDYFHRHGQQLIGKDTNLKKGGA